MKMIIIIPFMFALSAIGQQKTTPVQLPKPPADTRKSTNPVKVVLPTHTDIVPKFTIKPVILPNHVDVTATK